MSTGALLVGIGLIGVALLLLEAAYCLIRDNGKYSLDELWINLSVVTAHGVAFYMAQAAIALPAYTYLAAQSPLHLGRGMPTWIACWFLVDFIYYWEHRWAHQWRWLWAFHHVHHSPEKMSFLVGPRLSPLEVFHRWTFLIPAVALGFPPTMVISVKLLQRGYQFFVHTEYEPRRLLRPLSVALVTPSDHRVHHGRNPEYINRNYGGVFTIWDRMFGTYALEVAKVDYGVSPPLRSYNPLRVIFAPVLSLMRARSATSI